MSDAQSAGRQSDDGRREAYKVPRRAMRRRAPRIPQYAEWRAVQDARGLWQVVDECGEQPLHSPWPLERMDAAMVVAQAPAMRAALLALVRRLEATDWAEQHDKRDAELVRFARAVLGQTIASIYDLARVLPHRDEGELPLDAGEGIEKTS